MIIRNIYIMTKRLNCNGKMVKCQYANMTKWKNDIITKCECDKMTQCHEKVIEVLKN